MILHYHHPHYSIGFKGEFITSKLVKERRHSFKMSFKDEITIKLKLWLRRFLQLNSPVNLFMLQINFWPRVLSWTNTCLYRSRVNRSRLWFGLLSFAGEKTHLGRCQVIISTAAAAVDTRALQSLCALTIHQKDRAWARKDIQLIVRSSIYEAVYGVFSLKKRAEILIKSIIC